MSTIFYSTLPAVEAYHRPRSVDEAIRLLEELGDEAEVLAGGTDLLVDMRARRSCPAQLVDITAIEGLRGIHAADDGGLVIGATTTVRDVERSPLVRKRYLLLAEAARAMGTTQVNNRATVAGNVCRSSPSADLACPLLALDAAVVTAGAEPRTVPLAGFSNGTRRTVLRRGELVTAIVVPPLAEGTGGAFLRSTRTASDLARLNAAAVSTVHGEEITEVRIVLGSVGPTLLRARAAEDVLRGRRLDDALLAECARAACAATDPRAGDLQATPDQKRILAEVFTRKVVALAYARALAAREEAT